MTARKVMAHSVGPRASELMLSAALEPLLDRLASYIGEGAEVDSPYYKADFLVDRDELSALVSMAAMVYDGTRFMADAAFKNTMHELAAPLARVTELLWDEANYADILVALGAPDQLALSPKQNKKRTAKHLARIVELYGDAVARALPPPPTQEAVEGAIARYESIVYGLDDIARALPVPPKKRGKGRLSRTKDLRFVAGLIIDRWQESTGNQFKQSWRAGKPNNPATKFVHDVIEFIAPDRLRSLPEVTEKLVSARNKKRLGSWWRDHATSAK